jgi:hypothetical protein
MTAIFVLLFSLGCFIACRSALAAYHTIFPR